jgi:branched-chain amino acid transport system ATP-binding protein
VLEVNSLATGYGRLQVLYDVSLSLRSGRCVAVLGPNGAGKSTLLRAVFGQLPAWSGEVKFLGEDLAGAATHQIVRKGMTLVSAEGGLFPGMSVRQNLRIAEEHSHTERNRTVAEIEEIFPNLKARRNVEARRLSGGEQQMLAIARALVLGPHLIALDEPSTGLGPRFVRTVMERVSDMTADDVGVLLVEQNAQEVMRVADEIYVLSHGRVSWHGTPDQLKDDAELRSSYIGL